MPCLAAVRAAIARVTRIAKAHSRAVGAVTVAPIALLVPAAAPAATGHTISAPTSVCNYLYEWVHAVRFPIQADPHAAYSYVAIDTAKAQRDRVAFVVHGALPYAAWTSWDIYGANAAPTAVANYNKIVPDAGSVNPFVVGNRVLASRRDFTLLYLPDGVTQTDTAKSLQGIAEANVFHTPSPNDVGAWFLANRVYQAFPGYNQGGSGSPTNTPFPQVSAVNYTTGRPLPCAPYNVIPPALQQSPNNPPTASTTAVPPAHIRLTNGATLQTADSPLASAKGIEYAPPNPPGLVQFTRPPLAAGADVSSIPPPDNCAGYLGTPTSPTLISLIRMPHVPTFLDVTSLTPTTTRPPTEAAYVSFTQYGGSVGFYASGQPNSTSLGDSELRIDGTGGATVVVWPRILTPRQRRLVFAYANQHGWALMRGNTPNLFTTANLLIREKGSSGYRFGIDSVPCFYGTPQNPMNKGVLWSQVTGSQYVASPSNVGPGAPQGVTCSVGQFLEGDCLRSLTSYIRRTGGNYFAP